MVEPERRSDVIHVGEVRLSRGHAVRFAMDLLTHALFVDLYEPGRPEIDELVLLDSGRLRGPALRQFVRELAAPYLQRGIA